MTTGGASLPVYVVPNRKRLRGPVMPVAVVDSAVEGGKATPVYIVTAADIAAGGFTIMDGDPIRVSEVTTRGVSGGHAVPVYVVSGSLGGGAVSCSPGAEAVDSYWSKTNAGIGSTSYAVSSSFDNLPTTKSFSIEMWLRIRTAPAHNTKQVIISKNGSINAGWDVYAVGISGNAYIYMYKHYSEPTQNNQVILGAPYGPWPLNQWVHLAITYDITIGGGHWGTWCDGTDTTYFNDNFAGTYVVDTGAPIVIGTNYISGNVGNSNIDIGWTRISSGLRYTIPFTAPARLITPAWDNDTLFLSSNDFAGSSPSACTVDGLIGGTDSGTASYRNEVTLELQPDATAGVDTYLNQFQPANNFGGNTTISIGGVNGADRRAVALLSFDVSSIPATATIESAILELNCSFALNNNPFTFNAYKMLTSWHEGVKSGAAPTENGSTYQYKNAFTTETWGSGLTTTGPTVASGDYDGTVLDSDVVSTASQAYQWDIKSAVQSWVDGSSANYGVIIEDSVYNNTSFKSMVSSDSGSASLRPKLTIVYSYPG